MNAIIVEDDPIFRDMLLDMLPKATIKVNLQETCATIRQAKEAIEKHNPQLVLLDQPMERLTVADVRLVFIRRLGDGRRPRQLQQIAQLEPPPALHDILEVGLVEDEVGR